MKSRARDILFRTIRGRLWLLLLAVFLPVFLVQTYFYADQFQKMHERELQTNFEIARVTSKAFCLFIEDILHQEIGIAVAATASPPILPKNFQKLLLETAEACYAVRSYSWLSPAGRALVSSNPSSSDANHADRDYFRQIHSGNEWAVSNLFVEPLTNTPVFVIARRIRDLSGNLLGIVAAEINADDLDHVLAIDRSRQGGVYIIDRNGVLVYRNPRGRQAWVDRNWMKSLPFIREALEGAEAAGTGTPPFEKSSRIMATVPVSMVGWAAGACIDEEEVTGPILHALSWHAFLFLLVTLCSFLFAFGLASSITSPLKRLRWSALAFGRGEFTTQAITAGPTEIQELGRTLNRMAERLRSAVEEARGLAATAEENRKSLESSEELFRLTFDQAPIGAAIVGSDFCFHRVNAQLCRVLGYSAAELRSLTFSEITHPDDAPGTVEQSCRVLSGELEIYQSHTRLAHKNGGTVWVRLSVHRLHGTNGEPIALLPMVEDITEKRRAEDELRSANERVRDIMESITDAFISIDRQWRYTYVNPAAEKYLRMDRADLIGKDIRAVHPQPEEDLGLYKRAMSELVPVSFESHHASLDVWVEVRAYPTTEGLSIYFRDITQRKQMEEVLKKSRETLSSILRAAPIGIGLVKERTFQWVNEQFSVITGYTREELVGQSAMVLYAKKREFERVGILMYRDQCRLGVGSVETEWLKRDGEKVAILLNSAAIDSMDIDAGVVFTASDITEQRRIEEEVIRSRNELEYRVRERTAELERANYELRQIPAKLISAQEDERKRIGGELHDSIGQTLAALKYWVEMILIERERGNLDEGMKRLEQFVSTLQRSIDETRAIYMGLRPTMLESMGILATLQWLRREFLKLYPNQYIEMEQDVEEEEIPSTLKVVIFRITQEALNNISRHSHAEWVDVSLVKRGSVIELTIADDGTGFDVEVVLSQAHGRSLGLTGMKERAEIVGGMFSITSVAGEGTTIRASWPVYDFDLQCAAGVDVFGLDHRR